MKKLVFLIILLGLNSAFALESSESFVVTANDDHFKVVGPVGWKQGTNMTLQNKTLVTIYGEIRAGVEQRKVTSFSVKPGAFVSVDLELKKGESASLIPLSPSFQEVQLEFGRRPYEIPPQR